MAKRISTDVMIKRLQVLAKKEGVVLYSILYRKAGVGIQWFEKKRTSVRTNINVRDDGARNTLRDCQCGVVYSYWPTLRRAISFEMKRLKDHRKCHVDKCQLKRNTQAKIVHILEVIARAHNDGAHNDGLLASTLEVAEEISRREMPSILEMKFCDVLNLLR